MFSMLLTLLIRLFYSFLFLFLLLFLFLYLSQLLFSTFLFLDFQEFKTLGEKQVLRRLKEVNESLKKYASVNRKALDQYVSFNEQRENLVGRKEELLRDTQAIEQLVQSLDSQKVRDATAHSCT